MSYLCRECHTARPRYVHLTDDATYRAPVHSAQRRTTQTDLRFASSSDDLDKGSQDRECLQHFGGEITIITHGAEGAPFVPASSEAGIPLTQVPFFCGTSSNLCQTRRLVVGGKPSEGG